MCVKRACVIHVVSIDNHMQYIYHVHGIRYNTVGKPCFQTLPYMHAQKDVREEREE